MKKVLFAICAALCAVAFSSCSNDNGNNCEQLTQELVKKCEGKWKIVSGFETSGVYRPKLRIEGDFYVIFNKDKTISYQGEATQQQYYEDKPYEFNKWNIRDSFDFSRWDAVHSGEKDEMRLYRKSEFYDICDVVFQANTTMLLYMSGGWDRCYIMEKQ